MISSHIFCVLSFYEKKKTCATRPQSNLHCEGYVNHRVSEHFAAAGLERMYVDVRKRKRTYLTYIYVGYRISKAHMYILRHMAREKVNI